MRVEQRGRQARRRDLREGRTSGTAEPRPLPQASHLPEPRAGPGAAGPPPRPAACQHPRPGQAGAHDSGTLPKTRAWAAARGHRAERGRGGSPGALREPAGRGHGAGGRRQRRGAERQRHLAARPHSDTACRDRQPRSQGRRPESRPRSRPPLVRLLQGAGGPRWDQLCGRDAGGKQTLDPPDPLPLFFLLN